MKYLLLIIVTAVTFSVYGQNQSFQMHDLRKGQWEIKPADFKEKYHKGKIMVYLGDEKAGVDEYYLSDSIVTVFDAKKTGMQSQGKYMIRRSYTVKSEHLPVTVLEFIAKKNDSLLVRNIKQSHNIIFTKLKGH